MLWLVVAGTMDDPGLVAVSEALAVELFEFVGVHSAEGSGGGLSSFSTLKPFSFIFSACSLKTSST